MFYYSFSSIACFIIFIPFPFGEVTWMTWTERTLRSFYIGMKVNNYWPLFFWESINIYTISLLFCPHCQSRLVFLGCSHYHCIAFARSLVWRVLTTCLSFLYRFLFVVIALPYCLEVSTLLQCMFVYIIKYIWWESSHGETLFGNNINKLLLMCGR